MFRKGWDLKYATVSNSDGLIIRVCIKVPSEFGNSFPCILKNLEEILTNGVGTDLQQDMDKADGESVEVR